MNPDSVTDQPNAVIAAARWAESTLTGSLASTVAIIAVACVGMMMMAGQLPRRRAVQLTLGCFIIFSAHALAGGIVSTLGQGKASEVSAPQLPPVRVPPSASATSASQDPYDPYAGATVRPQH